jgi:hypothetical protein
MRTVCVPFGFERVGCNAVSLRGLHFEGVWASPFFMARHHQERLLLADKHPNANYATVTG